MNILELDSFNLSDAVKFHNRLNPKIWDKNEHLLPEVRSKLLEIAADFQEFLGLSDLDVEDITLSGSNAAYSYTPHSDIDLHLVVNVPQEEVYQELFNAKKYQYNDIHNIRIRGADVELYVQPADESPVSLGEYSIKYNKWIEVPKHKRANIDQSLVRHKYEDLQARIKSALKENNSDLVQALINKIKAMRQAGLDAHGEFGPENLAYKMLRTQGLIKQLYDHVAAVKDRELSLKEQEPKKPVKYGYGSDVADPDDYRALFKPSVPKAPALNQQQFNRPQDYEWYQQQQAKKQELASEDAGETWDGVNPTTAMVVTEDQDNEQIVHEFIEWAADKLGITDLPEIYIHTDPEWSVDEHSFGRYEPDSHILHVNLANRHLFDVLRTTAHELAHCRQNQAHSLPDEAGETGSDWENEAHAAAGIIMRDFADAHPELFATPALRESASGYIPTKKQARDPRYSMALTVDIKPGQVGKEANKMALDTDSQGKPALLMKTANMIKEGLEQQYLWHGSRQKIPVLEPRQAVDTGGAAGSNQNAIYATTDPKFAISMGLTTPGSDFGHFPNDPQGVLFSGKIRKGENVYLHKLPFNGPDGKPQFVQGGNSREFHSVPGVKGIKPTEIKAVPVDKYLNLIRQATPQDWELRKKYMKQGVAEDDLVESLNKLHDQGEYQRALQGFTSYYDEVEGPQLLNQYSQTIDTLNQRGGTVYRGVWVLPGQKPNLKDPGEHWTLSLKDAEEYLSSDHGSAAYADAQDDGDGEPVGYIVAATVGPNSITNQDVLIANFPQEVEVNLVNPNQAKIKIVKKITSSLWESTNKYNPNETLFHDMAAEFALLEEEYLGEIKMSPSNLRAEAAKTGAQAGMEFEMYVPGVGTIDDDEYGDNEPDYDQDESVSDIRDAVRFFDDSEYNTTRAVRRMEDSMREDFEEWGREQFSEYWSDRAPELIREYLTLNASDQDIVDILGLEGEEAQAILDNGASKHDYTDAAERVLEESDSSAWYDDAMSESERDYLDDSDLESEWLRDQGMYSMQDVGNTYDMTWPYYHEGGGNAAENINAVANDFSRAIGKPANASTSYHGATREAGKYAVEPDSSLRDARDADDAGIEFVSPPMPIDEMISDLNKVKAWAKKRGCYTNESTGLHINVSVPNFSVDKLDYVKLALLLGDKYVLEQFERVGNSYCKSAFDKVQNIVNAKPDQAQAMMDKMRSGLEQLASKVIHSGSTDKYTSINTKSGYIEFRSPGNDWLNAHFDKIEDTLMRFSVALSAAMDPNAYRQEYLKKLYKVLNPQGLKDDYGDMVQEFSKYMAWLQGSGKEISGKLSKEAQHAVRDFRKVATQELQQANLAKRIKRGDTGGQLYWWLVEKEGKNAPNSAVIELVASSKKEALQKAAEEWGLRDPARQLANAHATPLRPFDSSPVRASVGEPQAIGQRSGPMVGGRPSNPDGNWVVVPEDDQQSVYYRFNAANIDDANIVVRQWRQDHPNRVWLARRARPAPMDQPPIPGSTLDLQRQRAAQAQSTETSSNGEWGLWAEVPQRFSRLSMNDNAPVRRFDTEEEGRAWLAAHRGLDPDRFDIRRIPANYSSQPAAQAQQQSDTPQTYTINNGRYNITSITAYNTADAERQFRQRIRDERNPESFSLMLGDQVVASGGSAEGGQEYRIINTSDNSTLTGFRAANQQAAEQEAMSIIRDLRLNPLNFDVIPLSQQQAQRPAATGPQEYSVINMNDRSILTRFRAANQQAAEQEAELILHWHRLDPDIYDVIPTQPQQQQSDPYRSVPIPGVTDVELDIPVAAPPVASRGREFVGWKVLLPSGEEVYQFSGVGNSQSDANRIAAAWLRNNGYGVSGEGYEVVPVWREI